MSVPPSQRRTVLVTGASGSIGTAVVAWLRDRRPGLDVVATDLDTAAPHVDLVCDVTRAEDVRNAFELFDPDVVLHLAGAKHAPAGEEDPWEALAVNAVGTQNVVAMGVPVVTASTCKACNPETAYGASKLIAERLTLNAGGIVARFHNVVETQGNVFDIWRAVPADQPIPVAMLCKRYFISLVDAVRLVVWCMDHGESGARYMTDAGDLLPMGVIAARSAPGRAVRLVPPRRGDRLVEPLHAAHESAEPVSGTQSILRISGAHDNA